MSITLQFNDALADPPPRLAERERHMLVELCCCQRGFLVNREIVSHVLSEAGE